VYKKIDKKMIERICNAMKYFDEHGRLPSNKVRIDITLSQDAIERLKGRNRSKEIENLILSQLNL